jgi:hypothetical protein
MNLQIPIAGKYALSDYAQALKEVDNLKKKRFTPQLYIKT